MSASTRVTIIVNTGHCFIERAEEAVSGVVTEQDKKRLKNFLKVQKFHMYLYILEGFKIPEMDLLSKSDPYLVVKIGENVLNVTYLVSCSFRRSILMILIIPSLIRRFIRLFSCRRMLSWRFRSGIMIPY